VWALGITILILFSLCRFYSNFFGDTVNKLVLVLHSLSLSERMSSYEFSHSSDFFILSTRVDLTVFKGLMLPKCLKKCSKSELLSGFWISSYRLTKCNLTPFLTYLVFFTKIRYERLNSELIYSVLIEFKNVPNIERHFYLNDPKVIGN
jgi:hypothetical protein